MLDFTGNLKFVRSLCNVYTHQQVSLGIASLMKRKNRCLIHLNQTRKNYVRHIVKITAFFKDLDKCNKQIISRRNERL